MTKKETKALAWRSLEGVSVQGMQFLIQMILARLLLPEDFGIIAILNIFVNLANTLVQNGISSALLQKKDADTLDFSTVFFLENGLAVATYCIIFACAPLIARYYGNSDLVQYLRIFSLTIVISAIGSIQTTTLRSRMDFRSSFIANFAGILGQAVSGIGMALYGFGVWSLIVSQIVYRLLTSFLLICYARWYPQAGFSGKRFCKLFDFSWKLSVGWLIGTLYQDVFSLIVGKVYDETTLGYYTKGNSIPNVINRVVTQITASVMFPVIAQMQDDYNLVKQKTRKMISVSAALIFPTMACVAACAEAIVHIILTEKWAPIVSIIQIFCISSGINVVSNANMQSFSGIGRSDVFLKAEIVKRSITIILVLVLCRVNLYAMLLGIAFMGLVSLWMNGFYNVRLLSYSVSEYLKDIVPYLLISLFMFGVLSVFNLLVPNYYVRLLVQAAVSVILLVLFMQIDVLVPYVVLRKVIFRKLNRNEK